MIQRLAAVLAAVLTTALVVSGLGLADAAPKDKDVVVVNDATQPVPTQEQGTADVLVTNDASQPVPVSMEGEVRVPRIESGLINVETGEHSGEAVITVPAGKRFVVEYVTAQGTDLDSTDEEHIDFFALTDGGSNGLAGVNAPVHRNVDGSYAVSEQVLFYDVDDFRLFFTLDQPATGEGITAKWNVLWTIAGYMVDV